VGVRHNSFISSAYGFQLVFAAGAVLIIASVSERTHWEEKVTSRPSSRSTSVGTVGSRNEELERWAPLSFKLLSFLVQEEPQDMSRHLVRLFRQYHVTGIVNRYQLGI
jgi:hypothetical protein